MEDQGYICCYCGRRIINDEHTKIEHIMCQKEHNDLALNFNNLLASCDGGDSDRAHRIKPRHCEHCDAKKGEQDIPVSPLDNLDGLLTFFDDGSVKGTGKGKDLIRILGLDTQYLNTQRRNAIESYDDIPVVDMDVELVRLQGKTEGQYEEFCFVLEQHVMNLKKDLEIANENYSEESVQQRIQTLAV